ncbi:hypothetical protein G6F37_012565 [Rhizopus arrhizus]|nr:hypothetical protein G6F37_012565 [Rhizopus arrhizus]
MTLINKIVKENPRNRGAITALNQFHKRENTQSPFGKEFCEYWKRRETSEATTKAHKRRLDTFLQLNEDTCEGIEAISKNVHRKKANNDNTGGNSGSNVDQNSLEDEDNNEEVPDNNARNNNAPDNNEEDENNIETRNNDYDITADLFKEVIIITNKISVEKSTLGDETFDPIIHADLSFVEVVVTHFLNLITSPRNPLQYVCMERTTASLTTVFILNNLFLSNNDIVNLGWFEREIQTTGATKWDGMAFAIKDKKITPVLVEFSGGVKFNTTDKKERIKCQLLASTLNALIVFFLFAFIHK